MNKDNINYIIDQLNTFRNLSIFEIGQKVGLNPLFYGPNLGTTEVVKCMINHLDLSSLTSRFSSENIVLKTIRLKQNNIPKEAMSFNSVNFNELIKEDWETSFIRNKFSNTVFLFVVFQYIEDVLYFRGALDWKCPKIVLENEIKQFWTSLKSIVLQGVIITPKQQKNSVIYSNNLPNSKDNPVMHVRPKAINGNDTVILPDGQSITKQAYWLNISFVKEVVSALEPLDIGNQLIQQNSEKLTDEQIKELAATINKEIYTIEDFYKLTQKTIHNFSITMVTVDLIKVLNYKISVPYIFHKKYKSFESYFEQNVFNAPYFTIDDEAIYKQSSFNKLLEKHLKKISIIPIELKSYITKMGLEKANIRTKDLEDFIREVRVFTKNYSFFTYNQIVEDGFEHHLQELGFDYIFYESILKYSKSFSNCTLHNIMFFKTGNQKFNLESFYLELLKKYSTEHFSLNVIQQLLFDNYKIPISYDQLLDDVKRFKFKPFYSPELEKIFVNETRYYDYLAKH